MTSARATKVVALAAEVTQVRADLEIALTQLASANADLAFANLELTKRQSFSDALLETIEVGIVSCDADGANIVSNRVARMGVGNLGPSAALSLQEASSAVDIRDLDGQLVAAEDFPLIRALRGDHVGVVEMRLGPVGGPHREFVTHSVQIVGPDGEVLGAVAASTDVSAERAATRALTEEHRQLVEAQRIGQLGSFEYDFTTRIWTCSEQLAELWGFTYDGLVPRTAHACIVEEDREFAEESWRIASRLGGRHSYEYRIRRASDGVERVIRSAVEVELRRDGEPVRGRGTHLDVTDLRRAGQAAQRATAFLDAVLSATPDYTYVLDVETSELVYSSRRNEVVGIAAEELEALGPEGRVALIHPDDRGPAEASSLAARELEDGEVLELRYRGRHVDGGWRWLSRRVTPFRRDESGRVVETLGVIRDITDAVHAQERMAEADRVSRAAETHFEIVFEQAGIGAAIVGLDGIPTRVNPAACALFGRPEDQLVGRLWTAYNHPDEVPLAEVVIAAIAAGQDSYNDERRYLRPDGSVVWTATHVILVRDDSGAPEYLLAQLADITERKQMEVDLVHQALHDTTTGLPNRSLFADRVSQALLDDSSEPVVVAVMVLAGLHTVIDKDGYTAGDYVLKEIARRLVESVPGDVTIGHLQPGQFAFLIKGGTHDSVRAAEQALATVGTPILLASGSVTLLAGVGICAGHPGSEEHEALVARLIQDATTAAGRARTEGSDSIAFASQEMRQEQDDQHRTELLLRDALDNDRIRVAYQPVLDLATGDVVGAEALLRISDSDGRPIPPQELIPVAEQSGLIVEIGIRVLRLAAKQAAAWLAKHGVLLPVAVNVSAIQIEKDGFLDQVLLAAELAGVAPEALTIELTESVLLGSGSVSIEKLRDLRDAGIQLAIDDFGTGYASLSYLRDLPAATLKIDRSFVAGIPHDRAAVAIVASVIGLARNFGMTCIAEGIETEAQLAYLAERGVQGQGYLLGRPRAEWAISDMLARARTAPEGGNRSRLATEDRETLADRRDAVADQRDLLADARDRAHHLRDKAADKRDAEADLRDDVAARRDRDADTRDQIGSIPDETGQTRAEDGQRVDSDLDPSPQNGDGPAGLPRQATRGVADGRRLASEDRRVGATERTSASVARAAALIERHARARERVQAELDRNIALADQGFGAQKRGKSNASEADVSAGQEDVS